MNRSLAFLAIVLCFGLSSCQCSYPPPIGPVEDDDTMQTMHSAPASDTGVLAGRHAA